MKGMIYDDYHHTFVIAEAGSNWKVGTYEEDLNQAKKLIDVAKESGADAIKFQTYKAETTFVSNAGKIDYLLKKGINTTINEIFDHLSMPYEMLPELHQYCKKKQIMFMSTPFSVEDAKQVDQFVEIHKVASFEINHIRMLEFLAKTNKPILISTGASTLEEIDFAVSLLKKNNNSNIGLFQCTSKYPSSIESLNLSVISNMKERYNLPVGFSDHSMDPIVAPICAVGLGATFIEKHFTLDRNLPGPDHPFALNPSELKIMIDNIRKADLAKGSGEKRVLEEEEELRLAGKRAIQATKGIKKGEILSEGVNFDILRPGRKIIGLSPRFLDSVEGKKSKEDVDVGEGIKEVE
jgi:N,N'-diacetyllegionaminate synthase